MSKDRAVVWVPPGGAAGPRPGAGTGPRTRILTLRLSASRSPTSAAATAPRCPRRPPPPSVRRDVAGGSGRSWSEKNELNREQKEGASLTGSDSPHSFVLFARLARGRHLKCCHMLAQCFLLKHGFEPGL